MTNPASYTALPAAEFYARRREELRDAINDRASRYSRCTKILVALALLGCISSYQAIVAKHLPFWFAALVVPAVALVVQRRHHYYLQFAQLTSVLAYYEKGGARLSHQWNLLDSGEGFIDRDHFYSQDLDLFGDGSLYQLLCSARTQFEEPNHLLQMPNDPGGRKSVIAQFVRKVPQF